MEKKQDEHGEYIELRGAKVYIRSEEECAKCDYHVCMRVSDGPAALERAKKATCCDCGEEIWYDPKCTFDGPKKICMHCIIKHSDDQDFAA